LERYRNKYEIKKGAAATAKVWWNLFK
jgi:hypothetical protein